MWVFDEIKLPWSNTKWNGGAMNETAERWEASENQGETKTHTKRMEKMRWRTKTNKLRIIHKMLIEYVTHTSLSLVQRRAVNQHCADFHPILRHHFRFQFLKTNASNSWILIVTNYFTNFHHICAHK